MPFVKGKSGNPGGRRKLTDSDRALLAASTPHAIKRQIQLMDDDNGKVALLATNAVLDRYYGKPLQMLDIDANITDADPYGDLTDEQVAAIDKIFREGKPAEASEGTDGEEPSSA